MLIRLARGGAICFEVAIKKTASTVRIMKMIVLNFESIEQFCSDESGNNNGDSGSGRGRGNYSGDDSTIESKIVYAQENAS
ncbi:hypothetical protein ACDT12_13565, partial [Staphylococcus aureus]